MYNEPATILSVNEYLTYYYAFNLVLQLETGTVTIDKFIKDANVQGLPTYWVGDKMAGALGLPFTRLPSDDIAVVDNEPQQEGEKEPVV